MKRKLLILLLIGVSLQGFSQFPDKGISGNISLEHLDLNQVYAEKIPDYATPVMSNDTMVLLVDSVITILNPLLNPSLSIYWEALTYTPAGKIKDYYFFADYIETNFFKSSYGFLPNDSISFINYYSQKITGYPSVNGYENTFGTAMESELFNYNLNGFLSQYIYKFQGVDFDILTFFYDANNYRIRREHQSYNTSTYTLEDYGRIIYFNNSIGLDTMSYTYSKFPHEYYLKKSGIVKRDYDPSNREVETQHFNVSNTDTNDISFSKILTYDYDPFGNISCRIYKEILNPAATDTLYMVDLEYHRCFKAPDSTIFYYGQTMFPGHTGKQWTTYHYSTLPCKPDSTIMQYWSLDSSIHLNSEKREYLYDTLGNLTTEVRYQWYNNSWLINRSIQYYYGWHLIDISSVDKPAGKPVSQPSMTIFPNPATDIITIELERESTILETSVSDIYGKHIRNIDLKQNFERLDISDLRSGVYVIRALLFDGQLVAKRFVKL